MRRIYLDNNATTMICSEVVAEMSRSGLVGFANPASQHEFGRVARQELEGLRDRVLNLLAIPPDHRVLFTSGGTEANNLGILGHFPANIDVSGSNIVSSSIEHPSVLSCLEFLQSRGVEIRYVDPQTDGAVDPASFEELIDENTKLVCCMWGNNETGVLQPIAEIASVCRNRNIPIHVDAVQAIGKVELDCSFLADYSLSLSAHKIHGPAGVGALVTSDSLVLAPQIFGGFQQDGIRPGTESLLLVSGFVKALELSCLEHDSYIPLIQSFRDDFEQKILSAIPSAAVNGTALRLPHTTNISFVGFDRQQFIIAADMHGLACSTGSACSSGSSQPSHVLTAMKCGKNVIDSAVRFGFSRKNSASDVDKAVDIIIRIFSGLKASK